MDVIEPELLPTYVSTHCAICAYGWTRRGRDADGAECTITWCLLDREPVWRDMTFCDRYEPREG